MGENNKFDLHCNLWCVLRHWQSYGMMVTQVLRMFGSQEYLSMLNNLSWFMSLLAVLFCLSCYSLYSCFPWPSSLCFFPVGISSSPGWRGAPALYILAINPTIYTLPGILFSARVSCLFVDISWLHLLCCDRFCSCLLVFVDCVISLILFGLCSLFQSASPLPCLAFSLWFFHSGVLVLPRFWFSPSIVTLLVF